MGCGGRHLGLRGRKLAEREASRFVLLIQCCEGDQIREAEMGRACGIYETQAIQLSTKHSDPDVESSIVQNTT